MTDPDRPAPAGALRPVPSVALRLAPAEAPPPVPAGATRPLGCMSSSLRRRGATVAQWLRLPGTASTPDCASIRYWHEPGERRPATRGGGERSPVLFIHGYAGTEHIWGPLRDALARAGFDHLIALQYNAFRSDIHQVADWLVDQAHRSLAATGAGGVHLIGHSMGGLVARDAVHHRGLSGLATTVVTIATPHQGSRFARFVPGPSARQMRPGSEFLATLADRHDVGRTRWVAVHGDADRVVPPDLGRSGHDDQVRTVRQPAAGHGSVTRHPQVISAIVRELIGAESSAAALALAA